MLSSLFSCDFTEFVRRAMGCFTCCFRIRDNNNNNNHRTQVNRFSQPITAVRKDNVDPLASSCVWSLLANEDEDEDGDLSRCEDGRYGVMGSTVLDEELRAEAKLLKACGTLPQTPVEIRRNDKPNDLQPHNGDTESSYDSNVPNTNIEEALQKQPDQLQSPITVFQKWENGSNSSASRSLKNIDSISSNSSEGCGTLPRTPVEIRKNDKSKDLQPHNSDTESAFTSRLANTPIEEGSQKQPDQLQSPITVFQKWEKGSDSSSNSSNSLKNIDSISSNSSGGSGIEPAASTHCKNKSVHFKSQSDLCSFISKNSSPNIIKVPLKLCESPFDHTVLKPSPYPTPLKLSDDMQTPGTVFPSYGKSPRIRVQYVHSSINPRNFSQLDSPIEEECIEQSDKESPQSQVKLQDNTTNKGLNVCPTLSSWLPSKSNHAASVDQSLTSQTPGDRPILGVVTSDWNVNETSFTPGWRDANGIPNTTTKYSEDQKVNWHATPFEERLEKALSEDKFIHKMKHLEETTCVEY